MTAPPLAHLEDFPGGPDSGTALDFPATLAADGWAALTLGTADEPLQLIAVATGSGAGSSAIQGLDIKGLGVTVFINRCPHYGTALNAFEPSIWDSGKRFLMCQTHGALFDPESGRCKRGPCKGDYLRAVAVRLENGVIYSA